MGKSSSRVLVAVEDAPVVRTAELHPNQPLLEVMSPLQASSPPTAAGRASDTGRGGGGYAATQFNAVVDTNEHAVRLCESLGFNDSEGVHPNQFGGV
ncbi:MAG TPA: hypothetical protein VFY56_13750 [Propionibacteriaceae bacterium]|nr:hypothetical protein [Propionibacteriaceae bacterium]